MRYRIATFLAVTAIATQLVSCAPPMGAPPPVPPPQAEVMPLPPVSAVEMVWRPGHWNWDGSGYRWTPGEFQPRTAQTNLWRSGMWQQGQGGWVWQPPGWM